MKFTFELTREAAINAALNAGAPNDESAELFATGIQRRSVFKQNISDKNQYAELKKYQRHGYHVIKVEVA
jgi:hypothetical protein